MTTGDDNPRPDRGPVTEEQLLDWIDGRLSAEDGRRLAEASGRPGLELRVAQMRANKRAMAALGAVRAPADVQARVIAALEREALVRGQAPDPIPISSVIFETESRPSRWMHSPRVPLALAAGLLLAGSVGLYLMTTSRRPSSPVPGPIASSTDATESREGGATPFASSPVPDPDVIEQAVRVAHAPDADVPGFVDAEPPRTLAASRPRPVDETRAIELAREGRLVMRVVAADTKQLASLTSDARRSRPGREWRLDSAVPPALARAVAPANVPFGLGSRAEFANASADAVRLLGPRAMLTWPVAAMSDRASRVEGTYLAEVPMQESALRALTSLFAERLDAKVVFEELASPVAIPARLDAETALWWTRPSGRWRERVSIPIVVERK
ncbi:MAG: hypothetical protein ACOYN0_07730 [Phycisphaerales bacterium]